MALRNGNEDGISGSLTEELSFEPVIWVGSSRREFARAPPVHSLKNIGKGNAKLLVMVTPAGLEKFFEETFDPAADRSAAPPPASKAMMARFMAAAPRHGQEMVLPVESAEPR